MFQISNAIHINIKHIYTDKLPQCKSNIYRIYLLFCKCNNVCTTGSVDGLVWCRRFLSDIFILHCYVCVHVRAYE